MIKKYSIIVLLISIVFSCAMLVGCASDEDLFEIADGTEFLNDTNGTKTENSATAEAKNSVVAGAENSATAETKNSVVAGAENSATAETENTVVAGAKYSTTADNVTEMTATDKLVNPTIVVYVCGHVKKTGVYELPLNSRVYEAINAAGGLLPEAAQNMINQAEIIYDGQRIYVPSEDEMTNGVNAENIPIISGGNSPGNVLQGDGVLLGSSGTKNGNEIQGSAAISVSKININTASAQELTSIPGIGNTKASAIVSYRESGGRFDKTEDITNVSGIGPSTYEKIKDYISVN